MDVSAADDMQQQQQRRRTAATLMGANKWKASVDSLSTSSSVSTQASVYAPSFNPSAHKPTSDWYDSINDSNTSTSTLNGGPRLHVVDRRLLHLKPPPPNPPSKLEPVPTTTTTTTPPSLPPSTTEDSISVQGYLSDASSTGSFMRPRLKPHSTPLLSTPSVDSNSSNKAHMLKSPTVITSLSFKERNFNFDFENVSLTSMMGAQGLEELYGVQSYPLTTTKGPSQARSDTSLSSSQNQVSTHTSMPPQVNSTANGLIVSSQKLSPKNTSTGHVDSKVLQTNQDDSNTPTLANGTLLRSRGSSVSSSSNMISVRTPLELFTDISSEGTASESGEGQGSSLDKTIKIGTMGNFLLCIPKGVCMLDGNPRSVAPRFEVSGNGNDTINVNYCVKSLWVDAYQPRTFDEFLCHVQQAQLLRQLISQGNCPHIFFHGTSDYGKKLLIKVLLGEIFGPSSWKVFREKREFKRKGEKKVVKEVIASKFHVELDAAGLGENARTVLVGLCKEIAQSMESSRIIDAEENYETNFRVVVLYQIEKSSNDTQQLLRWLMDRYGDTCKLLLCSDDANNVLESIKARCQNLGVDPPPQQEIVNFLQQVARKENLRVSQELLTRIAHESKQNVRHAIESLEALKPSYQGEAIKEDSSIPTGWEDIVIEVANDIIQEQTPRRMFVARQKLQSLLQKQVSPRLILQSLVLELLKKLNKRLVQEVCYWHEIYAKRLLSSSSTVAIDKLEEFVARFMSIYKKYKKTNMDSY